MAITRVVATFPYFSLDSKDVSTNTFHFASVAEPTNGDMATIAGRLDAFYQAFDNLMSPVIVASAVTYKFFRLADPEPRVPALTLAALGLAMGTSGTNEEAAICLSYLAAPVSGQPVARRRGRLYIGPLATAAISTSSSSTFTRVASPALSQIPAAAAVLADQSEAFQWAVYSPTDNIARQIVTGYVDNAVDTQRRRGRVSTARTIFTGQP
jgi:hypothetical protein